MKDVIHRSPWRRAACGAATLSVFLFSLFAAPLAARAERKYPLFTDDLLDGGLVSNFVASVAASLATNSTANAISRVANTLTLPGVVTDYLLNQYLAGGIRIRYSSNNTDNYTSYGYRGVAVRRNAVTDDYLWETNSPNGILRRKDVPIVIRATTDGDGVVRYRIFMTLGD